MTILAPDATGGTIYAFTASRKTDSSASSQNGNRGGVVSESPPTATTGAGDVGLAKEGRAPPPGGALGSGGRADVGNGGAVIDVDLSG